MGEFEFIDRIKRCFVCPPGVTGIGDDCAVLPADPSRDTLVSTDMLVEGVHFLLDDITPYQLGWKAAAVNVSDIAAMGGRPEATFLSIALPSGITEGWSDAFVRGYRDLSERFDCPLLGGDTVASQGGLCINVTVLGSCIHGAALLRSAALPGDGVYVSGTLGDSAAGLKCVLRRRSGEILPSWCEALLASHYQPLPRVDLAVDLSARAGVHAMMDISDGVASDLRHILEASGTGAEIELDSLPYSEAFVRCCNDMGYDMLELALCGGEDYQLLFTAGDGFDPRGMDITRIGTITSNKELIWKGSDRDFQGFRHF